MGNTQILISCSKELKKAIKTFERTHRSALKRESGYTTGRPSFKSEIVRRALKEYMERVNETGQL